jgi:hypothetical protein
VGKKKQESPFVGLWHIVSMDTWDEDYFNEEVQAFIEFEGGHPPVKDLGRRRRR